MTAGVVARSRGAEFLAWLARPEVVGRWDGVGAFARWVTAAVEDGEVRPTDVWYPGRMKLGWSGQFPEEDWKDARRMYMGGDLWYCEGNGASEDTPDGTSCWVGGECTWVCGAGKQ